MEIAKRLGMLPQVLKNMYDPLAFSRPLPDNEANTTADEDEEEQLPLALDISSDSTEENIEDGGEGDGMNKDDRAPPANAGINLHKDKANNTDKGKGKAVDNGDDAGDFWATSGRFVPPRITGANSSNQKDLEDERFKAFEESVRRMAHERVPGAPPVQDGPAHDFEFDVHKVKGCSGAEMKRIVDNMRMLAEAVRKIQSGREELQYDLAYNSALAEHINILKMVLLSKRLCLERMMRKMTTFRRRSHKGNGSNGGDNRGHDGDDSSTGGSADNDTASGGKDNEGRADEESDTGGDVREHEGESGNGNGENHGNRQLSSTSKAPGKQVAPSVAAGQRAAQRMVRRMQRLPSSPMAGPSTSETTLAAPALLPAWDGTAAQGAQSGFDTSSDSDSSSSSPPPVLPSVTARLRSLSPNPITPPLRSSAPMRRHMANAQNLVAGLPSGVLRPPSGSSTCSAAEEPSRVGGLMGALALDTAGGISRGTRLSYPSAARAGEPISQYEPRERPPPIDSAEGPVSTTNEKSDR